MENQDLPLALDGDQVIGLVAGLGLLPKGLCPSDFLSEKLKQVRTEGKDVIGNEEYYNFVQDAIKIKLEFVDVVYECLLYEVNKTVDSMLKFYGDSSDITLESAAEWAKKRFLVHIPNISVDDSSKEDNEVEHLKHNISKLQKNWSDVRIYIHDNHKLTCHANGEEKTYTFEKLGLKGANKSKVNDLGKLINDCAEFKEIYSSRYIKDMNVAISKLRRILRKIASIHDKKKDPLIKVDENRWKPVFQILDHREGKRPIKVIYVTKEGSQFSRGLEEGEDLNNLKDKDKLNNGDLSGWEDEGDFNPYR